MLSELGAGIFLVPGRRKARYPYCNSLYIEDELPVIIDPASDRKELAQLNNIQLVLLSHFHSDHIRELGIFSQARLGIHKSEASALSDEKKLIELIFFTEEDKEEIESWLSRKAREMKIEEWNYPVSDPLLDQQEIYLGKTRLKIIHTPGHTIGHCCFWFPEPEILFSADIDLAEFGPWYGNACSSAEDFFSSIEKLKLLKPRLVITGHEEGIVKGEEFLAKLERFQRVLLEREEKIVSALDSPKSLEEIVDLGIIYGEFLKKSPGLRPPERRMVIHHLKWLEKRGLVRKISDSWKRD